MGTTKEALAESGLHQCQSWGDVRHVLDRMEEKLQHATPKDLAVYVEMYVFAVKNAVLWAFRATSSSPPLSVSQALALLHGALRTLHVKTIIRLPQRQHDTHHTSYYVSVYEKLLPMYPTRAFAEFGLVLSYCYVHESLLSEAETVASALSTSVVSESARLVKAWVALRRDDFDMAVSLLDRDRFDQHTRTRSHCAFWLAFAMVRQHMARRCFSSAAALWPLLETAIAGDVQPVACLNLHAWILLAQSAGPDGAGNLVAAGDSLARAMELDFDQEHSMFNYAMLLGRLQQWPDMQQMLQFCADAMALPPTKKDAPTTSTISMHTPDAISSTLVHAHLAHVAIRNRTIITLFGTSVSLVGTGDYATARILLQRLLSRHDIDPLPSPFEMSRLVQDHVFVLLEANAPQAALDVCDSVLTRTTSTDHPILLLYKADALLCLERLQECEWTLQQLDTMVSAADNDAIGNHYVQLLNNHALVLACQGRLDDAVRKLQECRRRFPSSLHAAFNLTVLLWRQGKKIAACALWLDARPATSDQTTMLATSPTSHVGAGLGCDLAPAQVAALNRLVDNYWGDHARMEAIQASLRVVEHFAAVM
ncbi:Aste57867_25291 [Aphanomyces stellatus]|uniref:Aste57867_25291 protein n=1 Tax=Aphanomyces stellatus TaxID=120398 RepID=A0A485LV64_9STRA|nr:hypothetical protein As57867_025213 [Aphanomyces stellatus]VFU01916.1 Aste57867_25291 [Aphanomyces stellatus]